MESKYAAEEAKLHKVEAEKQYLAEQVKREEVMIRTLQARVESARQDKVDLENALEAELEFAVNKLQKQLQLSEQQKK